MHTASLIATYSGHGGDHLCAHDRRGDGIACDARLGVVFAHYFRQSKDGRLFVVEAINWKKEEEGRRRKMEEE